MVRIVLRCDLIVIDPRPGVQLAEVWEVLRSSRLHVCPSVRSNISKRTCPSFTNFFTCYLWPWLGPALTSDDHAICYVLPVLWMTLCFHIMVQICRPSVNYSSELSQGGAGARGGVCCCRVPCYECGFLAEELNELLRASMLQWFSENVMLA